MWSFRICDLRYPNARLIYKDDDSFQGTGPGEDAFSREVELLNHPVYVRWQGLFMINQAGEYIFRSVAPCLSGGRSEASTRMMAAG